MKQPKIAIIGGGITGLSTAFYLHQFKKDLNIPVEITLFESEKELGGKIKTLKKAGFSIEQGPDSFLARKEAAFRLIKAVGLEKELVRNETGKAYVLLEDSLHPIPEGAAMGIPTKMSPFVTTGLFSISGKMRAAFDLVLPRVSKKDQDQSLGSFFRYRLGDEVVENLIEPLLSGIYAGDIDQLSLKATFPQFYQVEQKYRSLILGMKKAMPQPKQRPGERKAGIFQTLKTGLSSLVEEIERQLPSTAVEKEKTVLEVKRVGEAYELGFENGENKIYDYVIITTPHQVARELLRSYDFIQALEEIPSTSVATVALAFPESAIKQPLEGTGFVVSRRAGYTITAVTWTHKKWPHTTPQGHVLLRGYVGRPSDQKIVEQTDDEILQAVLEDIHKIMKIEEEPSFSMVTRWKKSMPKYIVGHKERIDQLKERCRQACPGIFLAGGAYEGIGVPDCIEQGERVAEQIKDLLLR